jgi:UDP-3-O-[3-hydroxymyristoyl] glucosamine N-acyltransferase
VEYDLSRLASLVNGRLNGDPTAIITSISSLDQARPDQIAYCSEKKYTKLLEATRAGAVVLSEEYATVFNGNAIIVDNPHLCFTKIAQLLHAMPTVEGEVHPSATVSSTATIAGSAWIGPNVVIEAEATIGECAYVSAGCYVGSGATIGSHSRLYPGVVVRDLCSIGNNCILHPGAVIGSDGFGFVRDGEVWEKVPQLGRVVIEDNVEVGANTTIDRGAIEDTVIHEGVKIDNLVQIAHNVEIGENTVIAGCAGIAGSAKIGKRCSIGGRANIFQHIEIADDVAIAATSLVRKSITKPGIYSSAIRAEKLDKWQRNISRLGELDTTVRRLRMIEKELKKK